MGDHYKAQDFIDAIPGTGGIISAIAKKVGCAWHTVRKYIDTYPTINRAYQDECEKILDLAESKLIEAINERDGPMIRYYLSTKGKTRGYSERLEIAGLLQNINLSSLTDEQLERIAAGENPIHVLIATAGTG